MRSCTARPSQVIKDLEDWCRGTRTRNTKKWKGEYGVTVPALKGFGELWHRHLCDTSASRQEASFSILPFPERTGADEGRTQGGRSRDCEGWCHTGGSCHCWESKTTLALSLSQAAAALSSSPSSSSSSPPRPLQIHNLASSRQRRSNATNATSFAAQHKRRKGKRDNTKRNEEEEHEGGALELWQLESTKIYWTGRF